MQNIINLLVQRCDLSASSRFVDIGAGRGKPNFHVAQDPGVCLSVGVEVEEIRWRVSNLNLFIISLSLFYLNRISISNFIFSSVVYCKYEPCDGSSRQMQGRSWKHIFCS